MAGKKPHPGGRPSVMTVETIRKLEDAFLMGCRDEEACFSANIAPSTLYLYCQNNPEFSERKETLKARPVYLARKVLIDALNDGDVATAHKVVERKDGTRSVIAGDQDAPLRIQSQSLTADLDPVEASRMYKEFLNSTSRTK